MSEDAIAVVVVTYDSSAHVGDTLTALRPQLREEDELMVVDNGSRDATVSIVQAAAPEARILRQDRNLGFAGGAHAGADATTAPLLLMLNPDALPARGCLDALRAAAHERPAWGAWQALVTMDGGTTVNTSGNIAHFLGMGWAGRCGQPVQDIPARPEEVPFASGAAFAVRREAWDALGGFDSRYFMYCEDLDLSLRLWLSGWSVGMVPGARVEHQYEFAKGASKWFLLERNRWWTVVGDYPGALLVLLAPALLAAEVALLGVAAQGGWLRQKLRAHVAVAAALPSMLARRRRVQALRCISTVEFAEHLSGDLDSPNLGPVAEVPIVAALQRFYWTAVVRLLSRFSRW